MCQHAARECHKSHKQLAEASIRLQIGGGAKCWSIGVARGCSGYWVQVGSCKCTLSGRARTDILGVVLGGILHSEYKDD